MRYYLISDLKFGPPTEASYITRPSLIYDFVIPVLTCYQIDEAVAMVAGIVIEKVYILSDYLGSFDPQLKGSLIGDKAVSTIFDNSKIRRFVPEFNPTIRFKDGIRDTINWFEGIGKDGYKG